MKQHMVQGLPTHFGSLDKNGQIPLCLLLTNVLGQGFWAQRSLSFIGLG